MGDDGNKAVIVNSLGREIDVVELAEHDPKEGQRAAADHRRRRAEGGGGRLHSTSASTAPPSSSIRATAKCSSLVSLPAYDPNSFAAGIDSRDLERRSTATSCKPLQNRALQGTLFARLDLQDRRGDGGARGRGRHAGLPGVLRAAARASTAATSSAGSQGRPRQRRHAPRDRAVVQRLLLHARQHARRRPDPQVGVGARPRRAERHRPAERSPGAGAVDRVEAATSRRRSGTPARRSRSRSARARCR